MSGEIIKCVWCKKIIIDPSLTGDSVLILYPEFHRAYVNSAPVIIGDSICDACRATKFSEFPKKVTTNDLATK